VLTTSGNCGQVAIVDRDPSQPTCVSNFLRVLRVDRTVSDPQYLFHYMNRRPFVTQLRPFIRGSTLQNLSVNAALAALGVPVPPLDEQRRIAAVLDRAEALRAKRREALAHLDALTQSIFLDMFGDPNVLRTKWPITPLGSLLQSARYGTSSRAGTTGKYPVLRMGNLTTNGEIDLSDLKYMDLARADRERYTVRFGDVVFNRTNSPDLVGKTAMFRQATPMAYAGYLIRLRVNEANCPDYVAAFMNTVYTKRVLRSMCKSIIGMANINAREVQSISIGVPPKELQLRFSERAHEVETAKVEQRRALGDLDALFASLQQRAFAGQL